MSNHIHFVGIGGMGMSSLAQHFLCLGDQVSGSDTICTPLTKKLEQLGAKIAYCHSPQNLPIPCDMVVYTTAVGAQNPELQAAHARQIPCIPREQMLGQVFNSFPQKVAICGVHGKTTTTSMIDYILRKTNTPHTAFVGGVLSDTGTNYTCGQNLVLAEACEYRKNFLHLSPNIIVALNVEHDHPDFFKTPADIQSAFADFLKIADKNGGISLVCGDNIPTHIYIDKNHLTFGIKTQCFYMAKNITHKNAYFSFDLHKNQKFVTHVSLNIQGRHNILNALAALSLCDVLNIPQTQAAAALKDFCCPKRRFMHIDCPFTNVVEDYAHHPTEIAALLDTAKCLGYKKIYAVFQPHTYSRTAAFFDEFSKCFAAADMLLLLPIFAAREPPIHGTTSQHLCRVTNQMGFTPCEFHQTPFDAYCRLSTLATKSDLVLIIGAGDIYQLSSLLTQNPHP